MYNNQLTPMQIENKGFSKSKITFSLRNHKKRTHSEAIILSRKTHPECYEVSQKTKQKLRASRLHYLKTHTSIWRNSHKKMSYPEKVFADVIKRNRLTERYEIVREYSIYPYYADFAFLNILLDVEIDGSQHWSTEENKLKDKKRDKILNQKGWRIYRIPAFKIMKEFEKVELEFLRFLENIKTQSKQTSFSNEIIEYEKFKELKKIKKKKEHEKKKIHLDSEKVKQIKY
jgi:very-short-patch-repair endonuclease